MTSLPGSASVDRLRALRRAGLGLAVMVALALPAARLYFGVETQHAALRAEAEQLADTISQHITQSPDGWAYETNWLNSQLEALAKRREGLALRVRDAGGSERASQGDWSRLSPLSAQAELLDSGVAVGRVELQAAVQALLLSVFGVALLGILLGLGVWWLVRHSLLALARSLSESEQARAEAEAANRSKSAFLATMSHEIRTPMNGVMGMAELLAHSPLDEAQAQAVHTIRDSAQQLLRVIDDVLDFSKIEAGRLDMELLPVELTPMLEGLFDALAPVAEAKSVRLHLFIDPELTERVQADAVRLRQVLTNLLGNAIKFSGGTEAGRAGEVSLRVEPDADGRTRFSVRDNGIGISADAQARLFQPFSQAEHSTTRRFGGTGLGLAITRRLVDLMQGRITLQSWPGEGSTFTVSLPLPPADPQPPRALPDLVGVRCALVRNAQWPSRDLRVWLEKAGAQVLELEASEPLSHDASQGSLVIIQADAQTALRLQAGPEREVRHVLLRGEGRREQPRLSGATVVQLDRVRPTPLLRAVAMAAGRASPPVPAAPSTLPETPQAARSLSVAEAEAQGCLILVADDDATNRAVIARQLQWLGHAAEMAVNGAEALQRWREGRYALLLTDLHMPEMDGYQLAQQIRQDEQQQGRPRAPLLMLTANALKGEAARAREHGLDDCLTKPIPMQQLQAALQRWLPVPSAPAPHSAAPATAPAAFDVSQLRALVGEGDLEFERELLQGFLHDSEAMAAQLAAGADLAALAHRLKSAARSIGAQPLAEAAALLEQQAQRGDAPDVKRLGEHLSAAREAITAHLEAH